MLTDRYGLNLSTDSAAARDAYVAAVDSILASNAGAGGWLDTAINADPDFGLPHVAMARVLQLEGDMPAARASADRAMELLAGASSREQRHGEIFRRLVNGQGQDALALLREHLGDTPRDALALSPACGVFGLIGFSGRSGREREQLELLEPLVADYGDDWWFLTSYGFALIEFGQWGRGRKCVERALELAPSSGHSVHVYAHALYEAGDNQTALDYLANWMPHYPADAPLHCHLWWHVALLRLMLGDTDGMWRTYDEHCAPSISVSPPINVASDGVSLLWRAALAPGAQTSRTAHVQCRWDAVRDFTSAKFPAPMVFVDFHHALSLAVGGDERAFGQYLETLEALGRDQRLPAGLVPAQLARAFASYVQGNWPGAIVRLEAVWPEVVRVGGSRAQRDVVRNTLLAAYVHAGRPEAASTFLAASADRQPTVPVAGLDVT